jgi:hypothetical protein
METAAGGTTDRAEYITTMDKRYYYQRSGKNVASGQYIDP